MVIVISSVYINALDLVKRAYILIDSKQVRYWQNTTGFKTYPASTTKIMTGILAIELETLIK